MTKDLTPKQREYSHYLEIVIPKLLRVKNNKKELHQTMYVKEVIHLLEELEIMDDINIQWNEGNDCTTRMRKDF